MSPEAISLNPYSTAKGQQSWVHQSDKNSTLQAFLYKRNGTYPGRISIPFPTSRHSDTSASRWPRSPHRRQSHPSTSADKQKKSCRETVKDKFNDSATRRPTNESRHVQADSKFSESRTEGTHTYIRDPGTQCRLISGLNPVQATGDPDGSAIAEIALKVGFAMKSPPSIIQVKCDSFFPSPQTYH